MRPWLQFACVLAALTAAPVAGCSDPAAPPRTGSLEVTTTTSGEPGSPSYALEVDGAIQAAVAPTGQATIAGLAPGVHAVALLDLPQFCTARDGTARSVEIVSAATTPLHFEVSCGPPGSLRVITNLTGDQLDPDGVMVIVAGVARQTAGVEDTLVFDQLTPGDVPVSVSGLAANCALDAPVPGAAHISPGVQTTLAITIRCLAPGGAGVIDVVVTSTLINAGAVRSFTAVLDRIRSMSVPANGSAQFTGVVAGSHSVRLSVPPYCAVGGFDPGPNPVSVNVPADGTVTVRFSVLCLG